MDLRGPGCFWDTQINWRPRFDQWSEKKRFSQTEPGKRISRAALLRTDINHWCCTRISICAKSHSVLLDAARDGSPV